MASQAWMRSPWRETRGYKVLLALAVSGFGLLVLLAPGMMHLDSSAPQRHATSTTPHAVDDGGVYTGSFVVVPPDGYACWKLSFDNRTGRTWGGRYLDCNAATETIENQHDQKKKKKSLRMRALGATFRK